MVSARSVSDLELHSIEAHLDFDFGRMIDGLAPDVSKNHPLHIEAAADCASTRDNSCGSAGDRDSKYVHSQSSRFAPALKFTSASFHPESPENTKVFPPISSFTDNEMSGLVCGLLMVLILAPAIFTFLPGSSTTHLTLSRIPVILKRENIARIRIQVRCSRFFRPRNYHRTLARTFPHIFEKQKRQTAEVIAVQMTDDHRVERIGLDTVALHLNQQARPRFEKNLLARCFEKISGLRASTTGEGVTSSEYGEGNRLSIRAVAIAAAINH